MSALVVENLSVNRAGLPVVRNASLVVDEGTITVKVRKPHVPLPGPVEFAEVSIPSLSHWLGIRTCGPETSAY